LDLLGPFSFARIREESESDADSDCDGLLCGEEQQQQQRRERLNALKVGTRERLIFKVFQFLEGTF